MAEIRIQKKRKAVWPWILILVIIITAAAWFLLKDNEYIKEKAADILPDSAAAFKINDLSVSGSKADEFINFVKDSIHATNIHNYTKNGLNKLSESLNSIIAENDSLKRSLENKGNSLKRITSNINPYSGVQQIKTAFLASTDLMKSMQEVKFKNLSTEVSKVKTTAESLNTNQPIQAQENKIKDFFRRSSSVVQEMNK
ncbi:MAG: hypothetical protein ACM34O_03995 [Ignavibacteria bacterium]